MKMERIALVTDSTCDATDAELAALGVSCAHLSVEAADGTPLDVDNEPASIERFYAYLDSCAELPKTSMPMPVQFGEIYSRLALEGYTHVVSVHISERFSGACQAARMATESADIEVAVVDSRRTCWPLFLVVRALAQLRDAGTCFSELVRAARELASASNVCFSVGSMRNLVMGGRAGKAAGLAASLLDIKPVLTIDDDGVVYSAAKAKSTKRALSRIADMAERAVVRFGPIEGLFVHTGDLGGVAMLRSLFSERGIAFDELGVRACGPAIATHVGTGCVGFSYIRKTAR